MVVFRPDFSGSGRWADWRSERETVENLHSPSKSTKGAEYFGPFGFATLDGCGGWI